MLMLQPVRRDLDQAVRVLALHQAAALLVQALVSSGGQQGSVACKTSGSGSAAASAGGKSCPR